MKVRGVPVGESRDAILVCGRHVPMLLVVVAVRETPVCLEFLVLGSEFLVFVSCF